MTWIHTEDEFEGRPIEEALIEREEKRRRLVEGLAMLTPRQREAVFYTVALGLTQAEAGEALGVGQAAISRRLKRSRQ